MTQKNNGNNTPSDLVKAARKATKSAIETGSVTAAIGDAISEVKADSVAGVSDALSLMLAEVKAMREDAARREAADREERAQLLAKLNAPKVRTVKVAPDGTQVVSSGKRGKPPTAGLDDCRDADGKVRKVGVRMYANEASGDRKGTYRLAARGTHGPGLGECISKQAACPYDAKQLAVIEAASQFLPFGLRFALQAVTDATVKLVPARHLTEIEAAGATVVQGLLTSVGLDLDAWTKLRTTVDGTGEGEINATDDATDDATDGDDGDDFGGVEV